MRNLRRAVGRGMGFMNRLKSHSAFTMAEILLSLTIIGVVAAITLPSLTGNINERTWATQKKALYARMSQAFPLMDSINTYDDAQSFIAAALNSVTKINNVCAQDRVSDCGIDTNSVGTLTGGTITSYGSDWYTWGNLGVNVASSGTPDIKTSTADTNLVAAFETGNGESVVLYYNPTCIPDQEVSPTLNTVESWVPYVCANLVYDLNNSKGPNTVGKDIGFMTVFFPTDSIVVSPIPDVNTTGTETTTSSGGETVDATAGSCATDEYRIPNKYEAMSMALNNKFVQDAVITGATAASGTEGAPGYVAAQPGLPAIVSSSKGANTNTTFIYKVEGKGLIPKDSAAGQTRCVKR